MHKGVGLKLFFLLFIGREQELFQYLFFCLFKYFFFCYGVFVLLFICSEQNLVKSANHHDLFIFYFCG